MRPTGSLAIVLLTGSALATPAGAQVGLYGAFKQGSYTQTADNTPPTTSSAWQFGAFLGTAALPDANTCTLTFAGPGSPFSMPQVAGVAAFRNSAPQFTSEAAMDADFPPGTYTLTISGGTLGTQADTAELPIGLYPPIPYLTGNTLSRLFGMDPSLPFVGSFSAFSVPVGATSGLTSISITRGSGIVPAFNQTFTPSATGFTIPAGTLTPGTFYIFGLGHAVMIETGGRFPGGTGTSRPSFGRTTQFNFATIAPPCAPDLTYGAVPGLPGYGIPNTIVNNDDFFYYLAQFAAGNTAVADLTTGAIPGQPGYGVPNGILNNEDFFYYLAVFAAGC